MPLQNRPDHFHAAEPPQQLGGAEVIGPILQGIAKPVHVLQRGVDVNDIVNMAAIAVLDAQELEKRAG